jgi:hypothetical protein
VLARLPSLAEAPVENLLVGSALLRPLDQLSVINSQQVAAVQVKFLSEIGLILARQKPLRVQANLVEHPPEINEPIDFGGRTPDWEIFHGNSNFWFAALLFKSTNLAIEQCRDWMIFNRPVLTPQTAH